LLHGWLAVTRHRGDGPGARQRQFFLSPSSSPAAPAPATATELILGRGTPSDLLFGPSPAVGFNLVGPTTLSHGIIVLNYEFDKMLA
jgi:hypothetical protein